MENVVKRHLNLVVLAAVLFAQIVGLAAQVKRPTETGSARLIRVWAVAAVTPFEKAVFGAGRAVRGAWSNYVYLRGLRSQNEQLKAEVQQLRLEQLRLSEDTAQARRLQALLGFKEQTVSQTLPAQVISTTGSEFSRGIYIDKGSKDGVRHDMPVITPDGIVGKVYRADAHTSLVLEINDPSSGVGVILQKSRLQGIIKGNQDGEVTVHNIMADETVSVGDQVLTSGGDRVFPKGLPVGKVSQVTPAGTFLNITVHPSAELEKVEEVLVVTKIEEQTPGAADEANGPVRAVDILAQRLPSVPPAPPLVGSGNEPPPTSALPPVNGVKPKTSNEPPPTRNLPPPPPANGATAQQSAGGSGTAVKKPERSAGGSPSNQASAAPKTKSPEKPKSESPKSQSAPKTPQQ